MKNLSSESITPVTFVLFSHNAQLRKTLGEKLSLDAEKKKENEEKAKEDKEKTEKKDQEEGKKDEEEGKKEEEPEVWH